VSLSVRSRQALCGLLGVLSFAACQDAHASFSLTFQGLVQTLNTGGSITLSSPAGIVFDPSGNVFVVDTGNNRIVEVSAQGVASVVTITGLSPSLSSPSAIATDTAGNLYIADTGNNRVVELTPAGAGSILSTGSVTLISPRGVALDQAGDLFIADTGNNRIVEVTSGGSAAALTITVSSGASTLSSPKGLGVNYNGTLYIADSGHNRIVHVAAGSTTGVVQSILGGVEISNPSDVQIDNIGNVYIADTGSSRIAEVDTSSNGTVLYTGSVSLNGPLALAVDPFGTVDIADTGNSRGVVVDPPVNGDLGPGDVTYSLNQSVVGFGHVQLGSANAVTLTLPFTTGQVGLGGVKVFASGVQNLDFTAGPDTTCNSSTPASTFCSIVISFLPTAPGLRNGAVVLYDTSLHPILTIPLYGYSDSPVPALGPNVGAVINAGGLTLSDPFQVALDGSGNIYVGDYIGKNVTRIVAGGGTASLISLGTPGSIAVQDITGVAVDGAGNLFIGDHQNSRILVRTPGGVVSVLNISGLSPALGFPTALALDAAGNLYIADFTNGRIVKISTLVVAGSTSSGLGTVLGEGTYSLSASTLTGLAIDPYGNIYIAARTQNNSHIIKVTRSGVGSTLAIPDNITPAISNPQGVAVDAMGNIYIVDTGNTRIVRITSAGVGASFSISGLTSPATLSSLIFGVTADSQGNLYIPDWSNGRIVFVNVSAAALTFPNTNVGATSVAKTATVTNLGTHPLLFSANPTYTANFPNSSADMTPCTSETSLSAGTLCDVSVNFTPQSGGSLSAGITVTDNALNVPGSTQQVSVSGTGLITADTTATAVTVNPASLAEGQTTAITAHVSDTATGHTSTVPTGHVTFTDTIGSTITSLNGGTAVNLSGGVATLTGVQLSGLGIHVITAQYAGVSGSYQGSSNSATVTLAKASASITGPATQPVQVPIGQTASIPITVTGSSTVGAPTGSLSYMVVNAAGTTIASGTQTLTAAGSSASASVAIPGNLAPGSYTINVTYSGDSNYLPIASAAKIEFVVGKITGAIVLSSSANPVLLTNPVTFAALLSSAAGTPTGTVSFNDGITLLGTVTLSSGRASLTISALAAGAHSITAVYSGDANFASVTSTAVAEVVLDFSLTTTNGAPGVAPTQSVLPGGTATYPLSILPTNGTIFPAPVTLSVTGLPPGATATLTPSFFPAGSPLTNVTLTIQLPATTASLHPGTPSNHGIPAIAWAVLLLPFLGRLRRGGRRMSQVFSVCLVCASALTAIAGLGACGSNSSGFFAHPQQTYSVVITATSGSISHSTTVTLIVQ
jgi:sugar lactone lactonase YvrE